MGLHEGPQWAPVLFSTQASKGGRRMGPRPAEPNPQIGLPTQSVKETDHTPDT